MNTFFRLTQVCRVVCVWLAVSLAWNACAAQELKVGLVLDKGGKDDKSFNASAYEGLTRVKNELKAFTKYVEATDDNAFEPMLRSFAQKDFNLIIAIGFSQVAALKKIAPQFPKQKFAIVDGEVNAPNVQSLLFEEHEGSFLVGAIAALVSKSKAVGFIGGMDVPLIRRFALGFKSGAEYIQPKIKYSSNYVGVTAEAWNNPAKAKELAVAQYESGADVVFAAAGASGTGVFDAAEEKKKFAIGVDSNQDWVKPGYVLTSMVKRIDQAVFAICQDLKQGKFVSGTKRFGLQSMGVAYTVDGHNEKILPEAIRKRADQIKADIIAGKIHVPDYYKQKK